jgi:hypothetical protein
MCAPLAPPPPRARAQANFERNSANGANGEEQYKLLLAEIQATYEGAKEFHQKG